MVNISVGPVGLDFEDIVALFRIIANNFSYSEDPDKGVEQKNVLIENEITTEGVWISKSEIELLSTDRRGVNVLYHYNSEAHSNREIFKDYKQEVYFPEISSKYDCHIFFIAKSAISSRSDHDLNTKDAAGFIAVFNPPIEKGELIKYCYNQEYEFIEPLWGQPQAEILRDYRFLRHTQNFTRSLKFPIIYKNVEPNIYLLDESKKNKIQTSSLIKDIKKQDNHIIWKISLEKPLIGSVLRIKWVRPSDKNG